MGDAEKLFVYGTLMKKAHHPMHKVLSRYAKYLGEATACGKLYLIADYPGMVEDPRCRKKVKGELYEILDKKRLFEALDRYEGAEYEKRTLPVETAEGAMQAWVYFYRKSVKGKRPLLSGAFQKSGSFQSN